MILHQEIQVVAYNMVIHFFMLLCLCTYSLPLYVYPILDGGHTSGTCC